MDVFCVRKQIFLIIILAFQCWIIWPYMQVPWNLDVFCVCTQIFLKMSLVFQRWVICICKQVPWDLDVFCVRTQVFQIWIIGVYEQVPRGICVFCVRTQVFLKIILAFQRWIICAYEQVHRDMCVFLCTYTDIPKKACLFAQIIQSWETFFKLGISTHVRKKIYDRRNYFMINLHESMGPVRSRPGPILSWRLIMK